jgi:ribosomal protein S18 acetylase RimI-like enzyme
MIDLAPFRRATPDDAAALADLVNMAGEGLPLYIWRGLAEAEEDPWLVGRQRAARESGAFSYRNAIVLEEEGKVVACLVGYRLPDTPEPIDYGTMPQMFVPLQELENLAPATWYVNVLACYPRHRGKGHGTRFLELADRLALGAKCVGLSIIVSDANQGARRLYERHGYRMRGRRRIVKDDWENAGANWLLLVKEF